ncbi:MAG: response regulator [Gammaproteobacteria bacterium]|nr:response regulator [Gammaproteobacteria bacterium]MDE2348160.1 response regulator [Gammaproteobacteria bacterium]
MMNILVVDDETDVRDALRRVLVRAGFAVRCTGNGAEALEEIRRAGADIVITDIIMPGIDGVETIGTIRAEFPAVHIIAISGGGNFGDGAYQPTAITTSAYLAAANKAGADQVLTKPFETADLLKAIGRSSGIGNA